MTGLLSFSLLKGLSSTTSITVDFGDGTTISYVNISSIDDGIKHSYTKVGIYQVSATATNSLGSDRVMLYLHVSCESFKCSLWPLLLMLSQLKETVSFM